MMGREDVAAFNERALAAFIASPPIQTLGYGLKMTSGTAASGPIVAVWQYSPTHFKKYSNSKNILVGFGNLNSRVAHAHHARNHKSVILQRILSLDTADITSDLKGLTEDFKPDAFAGFPSMVLRVGTDVSLATGSRVKTIILAGERLTPSMEMGLRKTFPSADIRMIYAANEFGDIGKTCRYLPSLNYYHPMSDVEIIIPDVDERGEGDIIVSKKMNNGYGIENYHIGDVGRMHRVSCPCGNSVTFEHLGRRGYDYVKLAGALIRREEFDRVAALFAHYIDDYRAEAIREISGNKMRGKIVLRIFRKDGTWNTRIRDEIKDAFMNNLFLTQQKTLGDLVAEDAFAELIVERSEFPFPQKQKDVRLIEKEP